MSRIKKNTYILGISAFYHDSSATLVRDGKIVSAAQEERFTRIKHDSTFPINAIDFCLKESNIKVSDLSWIVFYEKPNLKFTRVVLNFIKTAPFSPKLFFNSISSWFSYKLYVEELVRVKLEYSGNILFYEHHQSHAFSAFYPSPFNEATIVTIDGVGENATTTIAYGHKNNVDIIKEIQYPDSKLIQNIL
jgi:carbamoyltransferase